MTLISASVSSRPSVAFAIISGDACSLYDSLMMLCSLISLQIYMVFIYRQNTKTVICIIVAVGWWLFNSFYLILWIGRGNGASGSKKF